MGPVDHFSSDRQYPGVGLCFERVDDGAGVGEFVFGRGEGKVDWSDLSRVNCKLSGEAVGRCSASLVDEAGLVAKVREHAVDRLDFGRDGASEAERAGELVGE